MKISCYLLSLMVVMLGACSSEISPQPTEQSIEQSAIGSDRDAHGCIPSAGYRWCASENECKRPWELAEEKGLDTTPEAFDDFCQNEEE